MFKDNPKWLGKLISLPRGVDGVDEPLEGEVAEGREGGDPGDEAEDFSFRNHFVWHFDHFLNEDFWVKTCSIWALKFKQKFIFFLLKK